MLLLNQKKGNFHHNDSHLQNLPIFETHFSRPINEQNASHPFPHDSLQRHEASAAYIRIRRRKK